MIDVKPDRTRRAWRLVLTAALVAGPARALTAGVSGQAPGWVGGGRDTSVFGLAGLGYIPSLALDIVPGWFDAEAAVSGRVDASARPDSLRLGAAFKPYRAWFRLSRGRLEARAGLQKLAFGSAMLLRPLQWFDRIDPRDPTGSTDGVYALLGRYWFPGDANAWAWGLIGNSTPRAWEQFGTEQWVPELGGRVQVSVPRGEVAASYHHRRARKAGPAGSFNEDRLGLDGKWDVGVGLWTEATALREWTDASPLPWQWAATVGLDYTFGVGNGLTAAAEHLALARTAGPWHTAGAVAGQVTGLSVAYPLGLLDRLNGFLLWDWQNRHAYGFAAWQRALDRWLFQAAGFWGPERPAAAGVPGGAAAGKGLRLTVVFNH
ncbi:MAG: hypothetical protein R6X12_08480 [bacterium]